MDPFVPDQATVNSKLAAAGHRLRVDKDRLARAEAAVRTAMAEEASALCAVEAGRQRITALLDQKLLAREAERKQIADQIVLNP